MAACKSYKLFDEVLVKQLSPDIWSYSNTYLLCPYCMILEYFNRFLGLQSSKYLLFKYYLKMTSCAACTSLVFSNLLQIDDSVLQI
jgi:hypothetical protein